MKFFPCAIPPNVVASHHRLGAVALSRQVTRLSGGLLLRVMSGMEPWEDEIIPRPRLHVSVSVGKGFDAPSVRAPTDEELGEVWRRLFVGFSLEEDNVGAKNPHVRHLWQCTTPTVEPANQMPMLIMEPKELKHDAT